MDFPGWSSGKSSGLDDFIIYILFEAMGYEISQGGGDRYRRRTGTEPSYIFRIQAKIKILLEFLRGHWKT